MTLIDAQLSEAVLAFESKSTRERKELSARVDAVFARGLEVTFGGIPRVDPQWPMWVDVQLP